MKMTPGVRALLYSGDLLAVDLGTFSVKVLQLKARERSLTVLGSASREVWRELADAKSDEQKAEIYSRTLRELLAGRGFRFRNACISLPGSAIILRFLALPAGAETDPEKGLPAEARALLPFDEADAAASMLVTPGAKDANEVLLAVAQKKTVRDAMDIVRKAGLRPAVLINDALALANAYEFFAGKQLDETAVLVNIGAISTSVVVIENGVPRAARVFNIAGNTFTRAVKREFSVDLEESEKLKTAHGLAVPEGATSEEKAVAARVAQALGQAAKDLGAEILRTLDVFHSRRPADYPAVTRLVLAGGGAELKGLPERLAADTGMSVEVFRPMVNVNAKDGSVGIKALDPALAVSCGLGLSNTLLRKTMRGRINLIPRRARRAAIARDMSPEFGRKIAIPALLGLGLCLYGYWAVEVSRKEASMEKKLEAAAKAEKAAHLKFTKKKPVAAAAVKRVENPYSFISRLSVSGVMGTSRNAMVMLSGGGTTYVARSGRLYNANEEAVPGVTSEISGNSLALNAGGRRYTITLPK